MSSGTCSIPPVLAYPEILPFTGWDYNTFNGTCSIPLVLTHPELLPIIDWDCDRSSGTCSIPPVLTYPEVLPIIDWDYDKSSGTCIITHAQFFYFWVHPLRNIAVNLNKIHILLVHKFLALDVFINSHAVFMSFGPIVIYYTFIHNTHIFNVFVV
jgi:hypothetical protein